MTDRASFWALVRKADEAFLSFNALCWHTIRLKRSRKRDWVGLLNPHAGRGAPRRVEDTLADDLAQVPELLARLDEEGPEGVYALAGLSDAERNVIRMYHEGFTHEIDIALNKVGLHWESEPVVRLRALGFSEEQIARRCGASLGTVRAQLQAGRDKLQRLADPLSFRYKS